MRYVPVGLIMAALIALVLVNAGGLRNAGRLGGSILIVVGGLVLLAALFALLVTKPNL